MSIVPALASGLQRRLAVCFVAAVAGILAVGASTAVAAPTCATTEPPSPASPTAGHPCWVDVTPYPFGFDGNPVNTTSGPCVAPPSGPNTVGVSPGCYLVVNSLAFRAWNRGLASVSPDGGGSTPFGVWIYNGTRWFPDPTFPGTSTCKGNTVLWAGKLDYWLVGDASIGTVSGAYWPALCRFDRIADQWEPISIPKAALAQVPLNPQTGAPMPGSITSGTCAAWNDCSFFGTYGMVLHWNGQALTVAAVGLFGSPWLRVDYTAATSQTGSPGSHFAVAVAASTTGAYGSPTSGAGFPPALGAQAQAQPNGSPAPQVFGSTGGALAPGAYSAPTPTAPAVAFPLDLGAVSFNAAGQGWVAANPTGNRPGIISLTAGPTHVAPLLPISTDGTVEPCSGVPADSFISSDYAWSAIGVLPDGDAIGGGQSSGSFGNEPVLAHVSCAGSPIATTEFRVPDETAADPQTAPLVPADESSTISAIAITASNNGWAASGGGTLPTSTGSANEPPHIYQLADGQAPNSPAGNDIEPRPNDLQPSPPVYIPSPPVTVTPPPKPTTRRRYRKGKHVKQPAPIYGVQVLPLIRTGSATFDLDIRFRVRRAVKIGAEALRGKRVVAASGVKSCRKGTIATLVLHLSTNQWPTSLKFVLPAVKKK